MIKVKKGDLVYSIDEKDLAEYESAGYELLEQPKKGKKND